MGGSIGWRIRQTTTLTVDRAHVLKKLLGGGLGLGGMVSCSLCSGDGCNRRNGSCAHAAVGRARRARRRKFLEISMCDVLEMKGMQRIL